MGCSHKHEKAWLLPRKLTWNPKMEGWKMIFLFEQVIFRFHVSFRGSIIEETQFINTSVMTTPYNSGMDHHGSLLDDALPSKVKL